MRASIATGLLQQLRAAAAASGSRGLSGLAAARKLPEDGLDLAHFVRQGRAAELGSAGQPADANGGLQPAAAAAASPQAAAGAAPAQPGAARQRTAFIETYGW